jgi:hypothetical protein
MERFFAADSDCTICESLTVSGQVPSDADGLVVINGVNHYIGRDGVELCVTIDPGIQPDGFTTTES